MSRMHVSDAFSRLVCLCQLVILCFCKCLTVYFLLLVMSQDLKDFMRSAGEITFADAHKQRVGDG